MMRNSAALRLAFALVATASLATAHATDLFVPVSANRGDTGSAIEAAAKRHNQAAAGLTSKHRATLKRAGLWDSRLPFTLPTTVYLTQNGQRLAQPSAFGPLDAPITLEFESAGSRAFPTAYRQLLEDTFAQAQSTLNAVFGAPSVGGTVRVLNYDADIGDRDAVAGGIYVPNNGSGQQEIRFPVYSSPEATAVNFVHTLLLAHYGPNGYGFDAFKEGLVRAATMRVCRTPGALPASLDANLVESALDNTYDGGAFYDWNNQRALGGQRFIAPNLTTVPLPSGGSVGGLYLLRYVMSGSAWQKALVEYPGFAAGLNQQLYTNPALASDVPGLIAAGQAVINTLAGSGSATIEGYSFADWFKRQAVLETKDILGLKLMTQAVPIPPVGGTNDFGVFDVVAHYFETRAGGDEVLLSGTSYPIFWTQNFERLFPSTQEDRLDIAGAYGSVTPNLPNINSGNIYRTAVDIPVQDRIARVYLPAGAVATGSNTTPNDFFGTVLGAPVNANLTVRLTYGVTTVSGIPVTNGAFGTRINTSGFLNAARCRVEVIRDVAGTPTVIIDRFVNKGPGSLALDLRTGLGDAIFAFPTPLAKGLQAIGIAGEPFASQPSDLLGINANDVLVARWNGSKARYDIFPDSGAMVQGGGYFVRMPASQAVTYPTKVQPGAPVAVALRPGWNMVANPLTESVPLSAIQVVRAVNNPKTFNEALGVELGVSQFEFVPGANDPSTGAPESGTMAAVSSFAPGKMVFVRVLVPEGVTLVFRPTAPSAPRALASNAIPRFVMQVGVSAPGESTSVRIGQSSTATQAFDRREDSGLPPSFGGLQAWSEGPERMFIDMRRTGASAIYRVTMEGLTRGKTYRLQTQMLQGQLSLYRWRPLGATQWQTLRGPLDSAFRATGSTASFEFRVEAGQ